MSVKRPSPAQLLDPPILGTIMLYQATRKDRSGQTRHEPQGGTHELTNHHAACTKEGESVHDQPIPLSRHLINPHAD